MQEKEESLEFAIYVLDINGIKTVNDQYSQGQDSTARQIIEQADKEMYKHKKNEIKR